MSSPILFEKVKKTVGVHLDLESGTEETFSLDNIRPIPKSVRIDGFDNCVFVFEDVEYEDCD
jgi:hypothetical protein